MRNIIDYHGKWPMIGSISEEFFIEIVPDPSESESEGKYRDKRIREVVELVSISIREEYKCTYDAYSATMKAHTSLPNHENLERMRKKITYLIENYIPYPPSADHSNKYKKEEIIEMFSFEITIFFYVCITC